MKFEAGREFGLVPVESICGVAHVVRRDSLLSQVHFDRFRPEPSDDSSVCMSGWETEQFYVSGFHVIRSSAFRSEKQV